VIDGSGATVSLGICRRHQGRLQWITEPVTVFTNDPAKAWQFETESAARVILKDFSDRNGRRVKRLPLVTDVLARSVCGTHENYLGGDE
jgi:hypothetical protein